MSQQGPRIFCLAMVDAVERVSPGFVRVALRGHGLAAYGEVMPADAVKVLLHPDGRADVDEPQWDDDGTPTWPAPARSPLPRALTVRSFNPARLRLELDAMVHDGGLLRTWLDAAKPGAVVGVMGVRRDFYPGDGVTEHLLLADSSALPAVATIVESLPPGLPATVFLAVDHEEDKALLPARPGVEVHWVAGGSPSGRDSALTRAVRELARPVSPGGRVQAWIAAEAGVVRSLRRWALAEHGVAVEDLHATAYWKAGLDGAARDAADLARYQKELAAGGDPFDPGLRERVELEA